MTHLERIHEHEIDHTKEELDDLDKISLCYNHGIRIICYEEAEGHTTYATAKFVGIVKENGEWKPIERHDLCDALGVIPEVVMATFKDEDEYKPTDEDLKDRINEMKFMQTRGE